MLTADGCRARRQRLLDRLRPAGPLVFGDPLHLRYLANFYVDPFSLGADFGGLLAAPAGRSTKLFHDHRLPKSVETAFADEKVPVKWYDGVSPGQGPRRLILHSVSGRTRDRRPRPRRALRPACPDLFRHVGELRRVKDADEVAVLQACCRCRRGRAGVGPGERAAGDDRAGRLQRHLHASAPDRPAGRSSSTATSPSRRAPPAAAGRRPGTCSEPATRSSSTTRSFIQGYRSDFTNTLVVGAEPTAEQRRLFDLCVAAMAAGERRLRAGVLGRDVYDAVRGVFEEAGMADHFPHHAGHGLGLGHPEAPFLVKQSDETLLAGDVVTLEPGLYVDGVGGIRIEHNYLVTDSGFERLSQHAITLDVSADCKVVRSMHATSFP